MLEKLAIRQATSMASRPVQEDERCCPLAINDWRGAFDSQIKVKAIAALEQGKILVLPNLNFGLNAEEQSWLTPSCVDPSTKSVKFFLGSGKMWGAAKVHENALSLKAMLARYAETTRDFIGALLPRYAPALIVGNTSFRPVAAEGRVQSRRHDDRLLHVDSFPSRPMAGKRILRVFTNIDPQHRPRIWRAGEPFAKVAAHFLPRLKAPLPGSATLLKTLGITKERRTPYDHYMLQLHDAMKYDDAYQKNAAQAMIPFASGTSWVVFSDQVSHAALSGQHALEQTFLLPVDAMETPSQSPLAVLENLTRRKLA